MKYYYNSRKHTANFTDAMKQYVEKSFKSVEKFLKKDESLKFSLEVNGDETLSLKCQIVTSDNKHLLAEVNSKDDFYAAVNALKNKVSRLIAKNKKKKAFVGERVEAAETNEIEEISKHKHIIMDSISPERAIKEAKELGHSWYVFRNSENGDTVSIIYKRFEGDYGLMTCK